MPGLLPAISYASNFDHPVKRTSIKKSQRWPTVVDWPRVPGIGLRHQSQKTVESHPGGFESASLDDDGQILSGLSHAAVLPWTLLHAMASWEPGRGTYIYLPTLPCFGPQWDCSDLHQPFGWHNSVLAQGCVLRPGYLWHSCDIWPLCSLNMPLTSPHPSTNPLSTSLPTVHPCPRMYWHLH